MAFLTIEELVSEAPKSFLDILIGTEETVVNEIIADMSDLISTNIGSYYDAKKIFEQEGENRSRTVLMYLKQLVYFQLLKRRKPDANTADYDEAMKWLEDISSGKRKANLPLLLIDSDLDGEIDDPVPFMKIGSRRNYPNGW